MATDNTCLERCPFLFSFVCFLVCVYGPFFTISAIAAGVAAVEMLLASPPQLPLQLVLASIRLIVVKLQFFLYPSRFSSSSSSSLLAFSSFTTFRPFSLVSVRLFSL